MKLPEHLQAIRMKRLLRSAFLYAALVLFLCDILAAINHDFDHWWQQRQHMGVALAAFLAVVADLFLHDSQDHPRHPLQYLRSHFPILHAQLQSMRETGFPTAVDPDKDF